MRGENKRKAGRLRSSRPPPAACAPSSSETSSPITGLDGIFDDSYPLLRPLAAARPRVARGVSYPKWGNHGRFASHRSRSKRPSRFASYIADDTTPSPLKKNPTKKEKDLHTQNISRACFAHFSRTLRTRRSPRPPHLECLVVVGCKPPTPSPPLPPDQPSIPF